jgi:hypothetical protein
MTRSSMNLDYIAGLFDGEGSVILAANNHRTNPWGWLFRPDISIANNSRELLDDVQTCLGFGRVSPAGRGCYRWNIRKHVDVARFLDAMENRASLKRPQILVMREALRYFPNEKSWRIVTSRESMVRLLECCSRLRELNRRFNRRQKKSGTDLQKIRTAISAVSDDRINQRDRRRYERAATTRHLRYLQRLSQTPRDRIEGLYRHSSLTVPAIVRELGLTRRVFYQTLRFYGVDRDHRKGAPLHRGPRFPYTVRNHSFCRGVSSLISPSVRPQSQTKISSCPE